MKSHLIIYVPGLHDQHFFNKLTTSLISHIWKAHGYSFYTLSPRWESGTSFSETLQQLLTLIDTASKEEKKVFLIGQSAGGSLVLNAFAKRNHTVYAAINVCGRLHKGNHVWPSLALAAKGSHSFKDSVITFETIHEPHLSNKDRKKILTVRLVFDEIVPASTVGVKGSTNVVFPFIEHSLGCILILTLGSRNLMKFLKER